MSTDRAALPRLSKELWLMKSQDRAWPRRPWLPVCCCGLETLQLLRTLSTPFGCHIPSPRTFAALFITNTSTKTHLHDQKPTINVALFIESTPNSTTSGNLMFTRSKKQKILLLLIRTKFSITCFSIKKKCTSAHLSQQQPGLSDSCHYINVFCQ